MVVVLAKIKRALRISPHYNNRGIEVLPELDTVEAGIVLTIDELSALADSMVR